MADARCRPDKSLTAAPLRSATPISEGDSATVSRAVCVRTSLCSDTVMTRTTIAPSRSSVTIISPVRAGVSYRLDKRIIAAPMRIAASPLQQASLSRWAIWWRGGGDPAFNWNGSAPGYGKVCNQARMTATKHSASQVRSQTVWRSSSEDRARARGARLRPSTRAVTIQTDAGSNTASPLANGVSASRIEFAAAARSSAGWPSSARLTGPISSAPCTAPSRPRPIAASSNNGHGSIWTR